MRDASFQTKSGMLRYPSPEPVRKRKEKTRENEQTVGSVLNGGGEGYILSKSHKVAAVI